MNGGSSGTARGKGSFYAVLTGSWEVGLNEYKGKVKNADGRCLDLEIHFNVPTLSKRSLESSRKPFLFFKRPVSHVRRRRKRTHIKSRFCL